MTADELARQQAHEAGQDEQVDPALLPKLFEGGFTGGASVSIGQHGRGNAALPGEAQPRRESVVAGHEKRLHVGFFRGDAIDDGLHVRAAAGDENADLAGHALTTRPTRRGFSPSDSRTAATSASSSGETMKT